jgi:hypothetical protein
MANAGIISRRGVIRLGGAASVGAGLGLLLPGCGGGGDSSSLLQQPAAGNTTRKSASIPSVVFYNNIDGQRTLEWCWAACAETIVRQFGINVNINGMSVAQEYFAYKVYGSDPVHAARPDQVAFALTDNYRLINNQPISLQGFSYLGIPPEFNPKAVALIKAQIPFTILLVPYATSSGHFLTVYEITWTEDANGNVISIDSYLMADPAQNLYQFLPGIAPFPTQWNPLAAQFYLQAGVAWAERVG